MFKNISRTQLFPLSETKGQSILDAERSKAKTILFFAPDFSLVLTIRPWICPRGRVISGPNTSEYTDETKLPHAAATFTK